MNKYKHKLELDTNTAPVLLLALNQLLDTLKKIPEYDKTQAVVEDLIFFTEDIIANE